MVRAKDSNSLDPGHVQDAVDALNCLAIPCDAVRAAEVRSEFHAWLAEHFDLDEGQLSAMTLAVNEALANAVEHAYAGDGRTPGTIDLHSHYQPSSSQLAVTVSDHGQWRASKPDPLGLRGRGIPLMDGLAHGVSIERDRTGTSVHLRWTGIAAR